MFTIGHVGEIPPATSTVNSSVKEHPTKGHKCMSGLCIQVVLMRACRGSLYGEVGQCYGGDHCGQVSLVCMPTCGL